MHKGLTLLHSENVEASRVFLALWGTTGAVLEGDAARDLAPAFPGCPCVIYEDAQGFRHQLFNPTSMAAVEAWQASLEAVYVPPLEEAKASKKADATAYRDTLRARGVPFNGAFLAAMPEDQGTLGDAITYLSWKPAGSTIKWKAKNGWLDVDATTIRAAAEAVGDFIEALYAAEHAHFVAIDALPSVEAVQTYDVATGWPQ